MVVSKQPVLSHTSSSLSSSSSDGGTTAAAAAADQEKSEDHMSSGEMTLLLTPGLVKRTRSPTPPLPASPGVVMDTSEAPTCQSAPPHPQPSVPKMDGDDEEEKMEDEEGSDDNEDMDDDPAPPPQHPAPPPHHLPAPPFPRRHPVHLGRQVHFQMCIYTCLHNCKYWPQ